MSKMKSIFTLSLGFISLTLTFVNYLNPFLNDYIAGFFLSFGPTLFIMYLLSLRSESKKRSLLEETDERLKMIKDRTLSVGYSFNVILTSLLIIVFGFINQTMIISIVLAFKLLFETLFMVITKRHLSRKY